MSLVLVEAIKPEISLITLNQPERLNVLSMQLIADLNKALDALENDNQVKCVILTGKGKAFSAGADLTEVQLTASKFIQENDFIEDWQRLAAFSKPVIAAINGYAFGGGLEIALMAILLLHLKKLSLANQKSNYPCYQGVEERSVWQDCLARQERWNYVLQVKLSLLTRHFH